ncbi:MAG: flavodoxin domain-containing protein [Verrucomicrobiota bacterium]
MNIQFIIASQTGTAQDAAEDAAEAFAEAGFPVNLVDLAMLEDVNFLKEADFILGAVSTWGEGEPPDDAVPFFEALKAAPPLGLDGTPSAILALGDTGYDLFCECGKELERELIRHGGEMAVPRVDCDVWFDDELKGWIKNVLEAFESSAIAR